MKSIGSATNTNRIQPERTDSQNYKQTNTTNPQTTDQLSLLRGDQNDKQQTQLQSTEPETVHKRPLPSKQRAQRKTKQNQHHINTKVISLKNIVCSDSTKLII